MKNNKIKQIETYSCDFFLKFAWTKLGYYSCPYLIIFY